MTIFDCPICLAVLDQPTSVPCEHTFCYGCLKAQIASRILQCATCKEEWPKACQFRPNLLLRRVIENHRRLEGMTPMTPNEQVREAISVRTESEVIVGAERETDDYELVDRQGRGITVQYLAQWPDGHREWQLLTELSDRPLRAWRSARNRDRVNAHRRRTRLNLRPRRRN